MRVDEQIPDIRRQRRTSGQLTAKSISIKGAKRRFGDCARKAAEITPGDLLRVASATEACREAALTAEQKSAEGKVGHDVGEASEELTSFLL